MALAGGEASRGGCVPELWLAARRGGFRRCGQGCQQPASALVGFLVAGFAGQRISRRPDRAHPRETLHRRFGLTDIACSVQ